MNGCKKGDRRYISRRKKDNIQNSMYINWNTYHLENPLFLPSLPQNYWYYSSTTRLHSYESYKILIIPYARKRKPDLRGTKLKIYSKILSPLTDVNQNTSGNDFSNRVSLSFIPKFLSPALKVWVKRLPHISEESST